MEQEIRKEKLLANTWNRTGEKNLFLLSIWLLHWRHSRFNFFFFYYNWLFSLRCFFPFENHKSSAISKESSEMMTRPSGNFESSLRGSEIRNPICERRDVPGRRGLACQEWFPRVFFLRTQKLQKSQRPWLPVIESLYNVIPSLAAAFNSFN